MSPLLPPLQRGFVKVGAIEIGAAIVTMWLKVSGHPDISIIIRVTVNVPVVENVCVGFCRLEVLLPPEPGSPKFHAQL
jgi:hypothetical protein